MDRFDSTTRSRIMSSVKGKGTRPEIEVGKLVKSLGLRFQKNIKKFAGSPDLVFKSKRKVIFVHGCFWHQHTCKHGKRRPSSNQEYWLKKFSGNVARDKRNAKELKALGWKVLVVWECQLKRQGFLVKRLTRFLTS